MDDIRWKQRFQNFEKAYLRMKETVKIHLEQPENEIIQMALIQAFEFTFELGWKTMKDFLDFKGMKIKFARDVIKEAFATDIIIDGQTWIEMIDDRNLTSHAYDEETAKKVIDNITNKHFTAITQVYLYFLGQI